ncbi:MAG: hypothetical protein GWP91_03705 [Rhodobacterales bacterium]|nr:hypothetical protein [Rhodobacterales bacterium]
MSKLFIAALLFANSTAFAGTPKASSELKDSEGERHPVSLAFDGLLSTGWAEGEMGDGTGSWIEISLDHTTDVQSVTLWPGNLSEGQRSLREYGRPRTVTVTLLGGDEEVSVESRVLDPGERGALRTDIEIQGTARKIRISMDETYSGGIFNDMFVAEVAVNFEKGDTPKAVARVTDWLEGTSGVRAVEANHQEVLELYEKIGAEQFGDRDSLAVLMDRAGDGAPFLRKQVLSQVPAGFRVHALPPDPSALEALLKLKDSNAIPAIERAALRSRGKVSRTLSRRVEQFRAYQDLVGGGRRSLPPFGDEGWEVGALNGLGEPLPLQIDEYGSIWVADLANNRVQRFSFAGISEKVYGAAEAGISNQLYGVNRTAYVAGSKPGSALGEFDTALDLQLISGKDGDRVVVLDGRGQVTVIGEDGVPALNFQIPTSDALSAGVGGEGYLLHLKGDKLAVIWGNEGWIYTPTGEEVGHFELEDGSPTGAIALKNGKMGLIYGDRLVSYHTSGFRDGDLMNGVLGGGFEAWDINFDEDGKMWAVTDSGKLFKLKKPGKVEYQVQVSEFSLEVPRLAVYDGIAFITNKGNILKVDALELLAKQRLAEAEAALGAE